MSNEIMRNAFVLKTPYIDIWITDEDGNKVPFDILDIDLSYLTVYIDNDSNKQRKIPDITGRIIRMKTNMLDLGKTYYVESSRQLDYRDSDEYLFTYGFTEENHTFAISFPDPNDQVKWNQDYQDKDLKWYDFFFCEHGNCDVAFRLIDRERESIEIHTAWIGHITDHIDDYESAADVATWNVTI